MLGRTNASSPSGIALGLTIVGGTTRPAKATQNTIWINTDVEITEVILSNKNSYSIESGNLYVSATNPGYLDSNGNIQSNSDWKVTEFIELPDDTQEVTITMSSNTSESPCHAFYDASKNLLSTVYRKPNTSIYAVPANAKYIRMSERLSEVVTLIASYTKDVPEGAAWITIGNSGSVKMASPVGGDWITVYPLSAKQYVGGVWVTVEAKTYHDGEWVDWVTYLLLKNNQYTELTGGWTTAGFTNGSVGFAGCGITENGLEIYQTSGKYDGACTANKIELSKYTKVAFKLESSSNSPHVNLSTSTNVDTSASGFVAHYEPKVSGNGYYEIDITDISVACHIAIMPKSDNGSSLLSEVYIR